MPAKLNKILIAGRGEIALRIIHTAHSMGLATVGIYSEADRNAPWIRLCTESWFMGSGSLSDTYLNITKIVDIACKSGSDAVHPGYGFLSENWEFAVACEENDIKFIGPSVEVLKLMGNKPKAHDLVRSLGFSVPLRYTGSLADLEALKGILEYPVLVKATSGGGGKGMRLVGNAEYYVEALKISSVEAGQFFGNPEVYVEQFLEDVRHVEIQLLGDKHGNLVHLYERECSVQRRHQKLVEESPAMISQALRDRLVHTALAIARSINYYGAGTVEFLVRDEQFWFLEVNPRIQVEHGVTEMVTGIDIVREQILIAEERTLSFSQDELRRKGHAIETRIYAEDPENSLLPSPGTIKIFIPPTLTRDLRLDTGVTNNSQVLTDFDPLIAKLIVHANGRSRAIRKMREAVNATALTGITSNLPLLSVILDDDLFIGNQISTTYLENNLDRFLGVITSKRHSDHQAATLAASILLLKGEKPGNSMSPWQLGYWRNVRQIRIRKGKEIIEFEYSLSGSDGIDFYMGENAWKVREIRILNNQVCFRINSRDFRFYGSFDAEGNMEISEGHLEYNFAAFSDQIHAVYENDQEVFAHNSDMITAPQPGTIMDIKVFEGQKVKRGDYLLTIESMKLENTIMAVKQGYIRKIAIKAGDKVKKNEPLIYLEDIINN